MNFRRVGDSVSAQMTRSNEIQFRPTVLLGVDSGNVGKRGCRGPTFSENRDRPPVLGLKDTGQAAVPRDDEASADSNSFDRCAPTRFIECFLVARAPYAAGRRDVKVTDNAFTRSPPVAREAALVAIQCRRHAWHEKCHRRCEDRGDGFARSHHVLLHEVMVMARR